MGGISGCVREEGEGDRGERDSPAGARSMRTRGARARERERPPRLLLNRVSGGAGAGERSIAREAASRAADLALRDVVDVRAERRQDVLRVRALVRVVAVVQDVAQLLQLREGLRHGHDRAARRGSRAGRADGALLPAAPSAARGRAPTRARARGSKTRRARATRRACVKTPAPTPSPARSRAACFALGHERARGSFFASSSSQC